jgi:CTP:molybdopterin cytidylyltransferase MocA
VRIHAIILAAGAGTRIGGPKALLRIGGETFLARVARIVGRPEVTSVIAVLSPDVARVVKEAGLPDPVGTVVNPRPEDGMLSSLLIGLEAAEAGGADAVLVHPVDHPLVDVATVDRVIVALEQAAMIAVPSHGHRRGHPTGFARASFEALRAADPDRGARAVLAEHPGWVTHVPGDAGCRAGINSAEDYARWIGKARS